MIIYLVDGYNVIHHIPELRERLEQSLEDARQRLEMHVSSYLNVKKVKVCLVYDGDEIGVVVPDQSRGNLRILFSSPPEKADLMIKKLVQKYRRAKELYVVTNDLDIIQFARSHHAKIMDPHAFFSRIVQRKDTFDLGQKYDPPMSEKELAWWLAVFNAENNDAEDNRGH